LSHLEEIAEEILEKIKEMRKVLRTEEIVALASSLDSFKRHQDKLTTPNNIDVSRALGGDFFQEDADLVNRNKAVYAILRAAKRIEQNKFGRWGARHWREIHPKTINDKIYLVLTDSGRPMHFAKIADRINEVEFDDKRAHPATVHNELILDKKYVLVGRGIYGLKEWGYKEGTVADIIANILSETNEPISREEIINEVLKQRLVKKTTIILALMDKNRFEKKEGGYKLKS